MFSDGRTDGDTAWGDLLTAYDGEPITYDGMGNPTSYYNGTRWTFGWEHGRQLTSATDGTRNITYTYDINGMRTSKTVDGVVYTYYYAGGKLVRETFGSTVLEFFYDEAGRPYAMRYDNLLLYYVLNQQGDVTRLFDGTGVSYGTYHYDAWGNILYNTDNKWLNDNPLRYRGYVYDVETGLYYLQSRYYDPEMGRFISADSYASTGQGVLGYNMFTYCGNNPVIYFDSNGYTQSPVTKAYYDEEEYASLLEEWEANGVVYQSNGPGKGGKIVNSYLIREDRDIVLYILAIMHDPRYKNDINGTLEGVYFEWIVHNALYDFGTLVQSERIKLKSADLDFGGTIYDDKHGWMNIGSGLMWGFYMISLPDQAQHDLVTHYMK